MTGETPAAGVTVLRILVCGLALSIGWGVRGNWGHEFGAMIPGALAAMAGAIATGREDWLRRIAYLAFFGAIGWSFGGSMSYGLVQGYTHSGDLPSVIYGYACLFLMGALWGALGGAGTALAVTLERRRLHEYFPALVGVFLAWAIEDLAFAWVPSLEASTDWFDTDWIAAALAPLAAVLVAVVRRHRCEGFWLVIFATSGWWIGFLGLVVLAGLRMTPPRGDNWAGMLGMTIAVAIYLHRRRLTLPLVALLITATWGGFGFAFGDFLRAFLMKQPWHLNQHSVFEQTYGFLNGIGIALSLGWIARRQPVESRGDNARSPWSDPFAVAFTLLLVPYVNIRKNLDSVWLPSKSIPAEMYSVSSWAWFHLAYGLLAALVLAAILRHRARPLAVVPESPLGKAQELFLLFLWWVVIGNLSRYLPFEEIRLVTEGVVHFNACLVSALVLLWPRAVSPPRLLPPDDARRTLTRWSLALGAAFLLTTLATTALTRAVWGDQPVPGAGNLRFGPDAAHRKPR